MHPIHVIFGTESNNSADLADQTASALSAAGLSATAIDMGDFANAKLAEVRTLVVITSTYGNGDPPSNAESLHAYLMKTAPQMPELRFAVCALGDKTYDRFCQCGRDFDRRLGELGAQRIVDRVDCDVDYEKPWKAWLDQLVPAIQALAGDDASSTAAVVPVEGAKVEHHTAAPGTRRNPVLSRVLRSRLLCGEGSTKETIHVEVATDLPYEVGDSLGVWPTNDPGLVSAILEAATCDGDAPVTLRGAVHESSRGTGSMTLREALSTHLDLAHVDARLLETAGSSTTGSATAGGHVLDVLLAGEKPVAPQKLAESLRPLAPRQYSIASSARAHPGEAHFTIDVVRYQLLGKQRLGVASTQLAERAPVGSELPVYHHPAPHFRLPADDVPIIMIGPGTGIAPFRAFLQERAARGAKGRSWLFFGARNTCDFLYGDELRDLQARSVLTRLDVAFSRDQAERVYVQQRMRENARELYAWIEAGAVLYVCGDAKRMAPDVHAAIREIFAGEGALSPGAAAARLDALDGENRYRRDVY